MIDPTPTPKGVDEKHDAFLCEFDCTAGHDCVCGDRDPCAPAGHVSEVLCADCPEVLTPETVRGLDGSTHPLCGTCFDRWMETS